MRSRFSRRAEDFCCAKCGRQVSGDGYTNHCPSCLFSRHVDVFPGDRAERCAGLMEPVGVISERGSLVLFHLCQRCGVVRRNKAAAADSQDELRRYVGRVAPAVSPPSAAARPAAARPAAGRAAAARPGAARRGGPHA
jgi:hypothetical protein